MRTGPKAEYSRGAGRGILADMTSPDSPLIRVGLLGAGTVGATLLGLIGSRPGLGLRPTRALVRDLARPRTVARPQELLTTDPEEVLDSCDLLVEVMGGTGLAVELMLRALGRGLPVVTANKAALAERWDAFEPYVRGGRVHFEAAVMAGTPIVGSLSRALRGSQPLELHAILNGTCNYILGQLELGIDYAEALAEAQRLGFTEADPSLDVEGYDAAHKLTLLARLAFTPEAAWDEVSAATQGIAHLHPRHCPRGDGGWRAGPARRQRVSPGRPLAAGGPPRLPPRRSPAHLRFGRPERAAIPRRPRRGGDDLRTWGGWRTYRERLAGRCHRCGSRPARTLPAPHLRAGTGRSSSRGPRRAEEGVSAPGYRSTRRRSPTVPFGEALLAGLAPDGGCTCRSGSSPARRLGGGGDPR